MLILSIETSCDDTSIAIIEAKGKKKPSFDVLANIVSSQTEIHAPFGGVVPSLAARAHQRNLPIVLQEAYKNFQFSIFNFQKSSKFQVPNSKKIDLITVTNGPGLEPSLWAGVNFAKSLSLVSKIPVLGVNHLHGHIYANFQFSIFNFQTNQKSKIKNQKQKTVNFPALCLIVSGGHTQLILMHGHGNFKLLGETRDDAAGEAFDKVAKLLGLGYPGGPAISRLAEKYKFQVLSSKFQVNLPRPMINSKDYDFSFSGLKTAVLYKLRELQKSKKFQVSSSSFESEPVLDSEGRALRLGLEREDSFLRVEDKFQEYICAEFQQAVIDVLIHKTLRAAKQYKVRTILCGGGVMANKELREQLKTAVQNELPNISLYIPPISLCTDNAVMTGIAGYYKFLQKGAEKLEKIKVDGNLKV